VTSNQNLLFREHYIRQGGDASNHEDQVNLSNFSQSPVRQRCGPGYQERDTPTDEQQYTCNEDGPAAACGYDGMPEDQEAEEHQEQATLCQQEAKRDACSPADCYCQAYVTQYVGADDQRYTKVYSRE